MSLTKMEELATAVVGKDCKMVFFKRIDIG